MAFRELTFIKWLIGIRPKGLTVPRLRFYQQLSVLLLVCVLLPLSVAGVAIYQVNKYALKKELTGFTEQLAQSFYEEFETELGWQERQAELLLRLRGQGQSASQLWSIDADLLAVGEYSQAGKVEFRGYQSYSQLTPELRLPERLQRQSKQQVGQSQFQLLHHGQDYQLRLIQRTSAGYEVFQRDFPFIDKLLTRARASVHEGLFIVDADGHVLLSSSGEVTQPKTRLGEKDLAYFKQLPPGVLNVQATNIQREWVLPDPLAMLSSESSASVDDEKQLETVFVKLPNTGWGVIIESPYHVKQRYIRRAKNQMVLIILLTVAFVFLVGFLYILGIVRNFRQLIKGMKAIAQGNYNRRLRLIANFATPYEVMFVAGEFNRMVHRISIQLDTITKANKELAQLDQLRAQLIDTVSHELRTPLTSIKGYTARLLRHGETLDPAIKEKSLRVIKQQSDRLTRLVDDLLVIPDLERQALVLQMDSLSLLESVNHAIDSVHGSPYRRGQAVVLSEETNSLWVEADSDRLEQVWVNLFENAFKYSTETNQVVQVTFDEEGDEAVIITVRNEAAPMTQEQLAGLFQKFSRLDERLTRTTRGSGLGLFITKELVEAMGGSIRLAYEEGAFNAIVRLRRPGSPSSNRG